MALGPYLHYDGGDYECLICQAKALSDKNCPRRSLPIHQSPWVVRSVWPGVSLIRQNKLIYKPRLLITCVLCAPIVLVFCSILRDHCNSHHYPCDNCTIVSAHPARLQDHQEEVHRHCKDCGGYFKNANNLRMVRPSLLLSSSWWSHWISQRRERKLIHVLARTSSPTPKLILL